MFGEYKSNSVLAIIDLEYLGELLSDTMAGKTRSAFRNKTVQVIVFR